MSNTDYPNMEHYVYEQAPEFNHYLCIRQYLRYIYFIWVFLVKQNWTSGILREEAALFHEFRKGTVFFLH